MPRTMKTWNLERGRRGALRLRVLAACAGVLIASGAARSQDSLIQFGKGVTLRVVDQGTEDMGPLARSSRMSRIDLRMPSGFDRVYRVESSTLGDAAPARYARVSGALVAIFPRSEYATSERGTSILVPAGTVYAIGAESAATVMASCEAIMTCDVAVMTTPVIAIATMSSTIVSPRVRICVLT